MIGLDIAGKVSFRMFGSLTGFTVRAGQLAGDGCFNFKSFHMSTEIRNWDVVAKALEAAGATSSQMYVRAKALALGKLDPMPTSFPEAPYSISAVAG